MILNLDKPKDVTVKEAIPAEKVTISQVDVISINDNCIDTVVALVDVEGVQKVFTLWQGDSYIAVGNWTQEQANERILELI